MSAPAPVTASTAAGTRSPESGMVAESTNSAGS